MGSYFRNLNKSLKKKKLLFTNKQIKIRFDFIPLGLFKRFFLSTTAITSLYECYSFFPRLILV